MTARRIAGALGILATAALTIAACSGTPAATGAGATTPAATTAVVTPTEVATAAPPATQGALPSFTLPSGDVELQALLPKEIGGKALTSLSITGDQFLGTGSGGTELQQVLGVLGKTPADLSVAFGGNEDVTVIAYRVKGVPADTVLNGLRAAYEQAADATITDASYGGKSVKKLVPKDPTDGTVYIYPSGDVIFVVGGDNVTDAILNETFSKLP